MALNEQTQIPPPPRRLSAQILKRLKRDALMPRLFGLIWLATGIGMLVVFLIIGSPTADFRLDRSGTTADGTVTAVSRRGTRNPFRIEYTFTAADGAAYTGRSYSRSRRGLMNDSKVTVEYLPADPAVSRIQGLRYSAIPLTMYLLPVFFIVAGGIIWGVGVRKLSRTRRLCEKGAVTTGTVVGAQWSKLMSMKTSFRTPRRFRYELRYRFTDDRGRERQARQTTYAPQDAFDLKEGDTITVLFDRADPARSLAADVLQLEFGQ